MSPTAPTAFQKLNVAVLGLLALLTFAVAGVLAIGVNVPLSPLGAHSPLSIGHDRASALLTSATPSPETLARSRQASWAALKRAPTDEAAWLQLAYVDRLSHGRLTAEGLSMLEQSYRVAPFGPDISLWRVRFAFENWQGLTPSLRARVTQEVRVQWWNKRDSYSILLRSVGNPSGKLAAKLLAARLETDMPGAPTAAPKASR